MDERPHIHVEHQGAVGILTIDRRARFNSLDVETAQDLRRAGLQLARDRGVRAVPNNGHACGELMPAMMSPHWQCCTSAGGAWSHSAARSILNRRRASHRA